MSPSFEFTLNILELTVKNRKKILDFNTILKRGAIAYLIFLKRTLCKNPDVKE